jgi:hypothetical protein
MEKTSSYQKYETQVPKNSPSLKFWKEQGEATALDKIHSSFQEVLKKRIQVSKQTLEEKMFAERAVFAVPRHFLNHLDAQEPICDFSLEELCKEADTDKIAQMLSSYRKTDALKELFLNAFEKAPYYSRFQIAGMLLERGLGYDVRMPAFDQLCNELCSEEDVEKIYKVLSSYPKTKDSKEIFLKAFEKAPFCHRLRIAQMLLEKGLNFYVAEPPSFDLLFQEADAEKIYEALSTDKNTKEIKDLFLQSFEKAPFYFRLQVTQMLLDRGLSFYLKRKNGEELVDLKKLESILTSLEKEAPLRKFLNNCQILTVEGEFRKEIPEIELQETIQEAFLKLSGLLSKDKIEDLDHLNEHLARALLESFCSSLDKALEGNPSNTSLKTLREIALGRKSSLEKLKSLEKKIAEIKQGFPHKANLKETLNLKAAPIDPKDKEKVQALRLQFFSLQEKIYHLKLPSAYLTVLEEAYMNHNLKALEELSDALAYEEYLAAVSSLQKKGEEIEPFLDESKEPKQKIEGAICALRDSKASFAFDLLKLLKAPPKEEVVEVKKSPEEIFLDSLELLSHAEKIEALKENTLYFPSILEKGSLESIFAVYEVLYTKEKRGENLESIWAPCLKGKEFQLQEKKDEIEKLQDWARSSPLSEMKNFFTNHGLIQNNQFVLDSSCLGSFQRIEDYTTVFAFFMDQGEKQFTLPSKLSEKVAFLGKLEEFYTPQEILKMLEALEQEYASDVEVVNWIRQIKDIPFDSLADFQTKNPVPAALRKRLKEVFGRKKTKQGNNKELIDWLPAGSFLKTFLLQAGFVIDSRKQNRTQNFADFVRGVFFFKSLIKSLWKDVEMPKALQDKIEQAEKNLDLDLLSSIAQINPVQRLSKEQKKILSSVSEEGFLIDRWQNELEANFAALKPFERYHGITREEWNLKQKPFQRQLLLDKIRQTLYQSLSHALKSADLLDVYELAIADGNLSLLQWVFQKLPLNAPPKQEVLKEYLESTSIDSFLKKQFKTVDLEQVDSINKTYQSALDKIQQKLIAKKIDAESNKTKIKFLKEVFDSICTLPSLTIQDLEKIDLIRLALQENNYEYTFRLALLLDDPEQVATFIKDLGPGSELNFAKEFHSNRKSNVLERLIEKRCNSYVTLAIYTLKDPEQEALIDHLSKFLVKEDLTLSDEQLFSAFIEVNKYHGKKYNKKNLETLSQLKQWAKKAAPGSCLKNIFEKAGCLNKESIVDDTGNSQRIRLRDVLLYLKTIVYSLIIETANTSELSKLKTRFEKASNEFNCSEIDEIISSSLTASFIASLTERGIAGVSKDSFSSIEEFLKELSMISPLLQEEFLEKISSFCSGDQVKKTFDNLLNQIYLGGYFKAVGLAYQDFLSPFENAVYLQLFLQKFTYNLYECCEQENLVGSGQTLLGVNITYPILLDSCFEQNFEILNILFRCFLLQSSKRFINDNIPSEKTAAQLFTFHEMIQFVDKSTTLSENHIQELREILIGRSFKKETEKFLKQKVIHLPSLINCSSLLPIPLSNFSEFPLYRQYICVTKACQELTKKLHTDFIQYKAREALFSILDVVCLQQDLKFLIHMQDVAIKMSQKPYEVEIS